MAKNKVGLIIFISIIGFVVLVGVLFLVFSKLPTKIRYVKGDGNMEEFNITDDVDLITTNIIEKGCVGDEQSAAEIATAIFKSIYGKNFNEYKLPLWVFYDDTEQEWLIKTQLPKNAAGGSKYLIIKKSNAEVVAIWAEK